MESMKTRTMTKIGSKASNASKKKVVSSQEEKFTEREKKTIHELKKLYLETIKLDVELQREIYNMEKSFEEKHNKIFEQRTKIIEEFKKSSTPGDVAANANIPSFWLKVLKASYTEFISKKDEDILAHLMDIRTKLHNEPIVRFVIDFYFEPNEFFSNRVLTKTYYLSCLPDMEDPFTYDGAEIFKCEGCQIDWKHKEKEKDKKVYSSFFDFFNPPTLPDDVDDPTYSDINAILQNDFELGFYLKERVVPKAILFFTGEIADCQSSDSESEDDSDDDDEDDDDDDEEDDDDEDGSSANTPDE